MNRAFVFTGPGRGPGWLGARRLCCEGSAWVWRQAAVFTRAGPGVAPGPGGVRGGAFGLDTEGLHGAARVVGGVHRRAGHEDVRARVGAPLDGLLADAAVDLQPHRTAVRRDQGAGAAQFRQHEIQEPLPAEAGLDRHQQQHVEFGQQVGVRLHRRARVDRQPGASPGVPDLAQRTDRGLHRLGVDRHVPRAGLGVGGRPAVGVFDHQVAVHRQAGVLEQGLHHRQAQGQVRHEVVVHDVHVQPVRGGRDRFRLVGEPGEVRGQDAG